MAQYTNQSNLPLSIAVFLAFRDYDHDPRPNSISVTSLLKSTRQIILASRLPPEGVPVDLMSQVPSALGSAVHARIEHAWINHYRECLRALGIPDKAIERVKINPDPATVTEDDLPVYLEQRSEREICGFIVTGKFDFVFNGELEDFKNTSTYAYMKRSKDNAFMLQGSLYRWLNPHIITKDALAIRYIFSNWEAGKVAQDPAYPKERIVSREFPLLSLQASEQYVVSKLNQIKQHWQSPEPQLPECGDEQLMRSEPVFKYYKNPDKRARSTKNFDTAQEAQQRYIEDGCVGVVVEVPGMVKGCKWCNCFDLCSQKDKYIQDGSLQL